MTSPIQFPGEEQSNAVRRILTEKEPPALRTYTPSQAVLSESAGVFHWTPEGRRLYDYSSGVLVANLGHNPKRWMQRFGSYLGWKPEHLQAQTGSDGYFPAVPMTTYNAMAEVEAQAVERLIGNLQSSPGGERLETVMWAASGSEAVQKALWACLHRDESRDLLIATRGGFHGKKGLAGAVTGSENAPERDPRVKFISFPVEEYDDLTKYGQDIDLGPYQTELEALWNEYGNRLNCLVTEPYLGGGGSHHPPAAYLQLLQNFCREHDILFVLDEIQSNFGRTGSMYAFATYGLQPDLICLGKGLGNGVPVSAAMGPRDIMGRLKYGEGSDTWSANPLSCAAVLATLDEFENSDVLEHTRNLSTLFAEKLAELKQSPVVSKVRGEGMVFGVECSALGNLSASEVAGAVVEAAYLGEPGGDGIHLLGPLAGNVLRISPPMTITEQQARASLDLLSRIVQQLPERLPAMQTMHQ